MNIWRRALRGSSRPATLRVGPTRTPAKKFASSIGSSPSARGRRPRSTCWASAKNSAAVPFFWSQHYDIPINYVGHAEKWDEIAIDGDIAAKDCLLRFKRNGRVLAVVSIFRDVANLEVGGRDGARGAMIVPAPTLAPVRSSPRDRPRSPPARARCARRGACPRSRSCRGSLRWRPRAASPRGAC